MFKKLLVVVIVVASLAGLIGAAAALFTSTKAVDNNLFTSGTVILNTDPTTRVVTFENMAPGDQYTAPITVTNAGTLELRYAVTSVATDSGTFDLMGQLDLTIKSGVSACTNGGFATDGTSVYAAADLGSVEGINVIGNPTPGPQAGDRTLAANGGNEVLCLNVTLPINTSNDFQGLVTTATLTFAGEQTVNNMTP